ncbi:3',5'-cyclic-AMP phosphodiesterase [Paraphotobacterium marinum]|uniref:3',5'-cyclic-AMP phosphodiesterase n=1 Tax=Paraphotobacterium marinum TaxID=1755811 RepID=UPI0013146569|nr:3',5'-cyclic-AMP phosphodiesterase [Paraphotobacterium marinum]
MNLLKLRSKNRIIKILQITDTHLFKSSREKLLGISTNDSFLEVVSNINKSQSEYDLVLITGDISQDHTYESYEFFFHQIRSLKLPFVFIPGNHDEGIQLNNVIKQLKIEQYEQVLINDSWQIILLDSQVKNEVNGGLSDRQLFSLEQNLESNSLFSLIALHHPPLECDCKWLDEHKFDNQHKFWSTIVNYSSKLKGIICGHIHQNYEKNHHDIKLLATPSTCIQFKPLSHEFCLDDKNPGWRVLELSPDGKLTSEVFRISNNNFLPDFESKGY